MPLYEELQKKEGVEYIAGVGKDDVAATMRDCCKKDGVNVAYMECDKPTGKCAVCVTGVERSLCAYLSAANEYKVEHLKEPANMAILEKAKIVYSSGFFTTVSPDSLALLSKTCLDGDKTFCFNLS